MMWLRCVIFCDLGLAARLLPEKKLGPAIMFCWGALLGVIRVGGPERGAESTILLMKVVLFLIALSCKAAMTYCVR